MMTFASMTCVQLGLAVSVGLVHQLGSLGVTGLRLAWAAAVLLVVARPRPAHFTRSGLLACAVLGVVTAGLTLFFMCAVTRMPLGTASALEFLGPLGVAVYGGRRGTKKWALVAGAGVLLLTQPWHGGADPAGVAFALAAAACWAAYILFTQRVGDESAGLRGLAVSMAVAGVVATLVAVPYGLGNVTWPLLLVGLGLAVLHPVLPFSLEFLALRRLNTASFGTLMSLEPAIALGIGFAVLGQVPGVVSAAGIALVVLAGVAAARTGGRGTEDGERQGGERQGGERQDGTAPGEGAA